MAYIETHGIRIRRRRGWLTASSVIAIIAMIIALISTISTIYFARENQNLQNSLYNFQPFIFSNYTTSTLNTRYCMRNDTFADLRGLVTIDLKVITPYDGMLTIKVKTLNFTHIGEPSYAGLEFLDMNYLNFSEHSIFDYKTTPHHISF